MLRLFKLSIFSLALIVLSGCARDIPLKVSSESATSIAISHGTELERTAIANKKCAALGSLYTPVIIAQTTDPRVNSITYGCNIRPQTELTGIGLKALQMRRFNVSAEKLTLGIIEHSGDRSGQCYTQDQVPQLKKGVGGDSGYRITCSIGRSWYQHHLQEKKGQTLLRTRLSLPNAFQFPYVYNPIGVQITEPEPYQTIFKEIADQLFIEAIELTPGEMR